MTKLKSEDYSYRYSFTVTKLRKRKLELEIPSLSSILHSSELGIQAVAPMEDFVIVAVGFA
jgi:hypothetical protein